MLHKLGLLQPENGPARSFEEAEKVVDRIGYPVVVRPSYVLGGRAMEIVYDSESFMASALSPATVILQNLLRGSGNRTEGANDERGGWTTWTPEGEH